MSRVSFGTDKAEQYRRTRATPSLLGGLWETDSGQQTFTDGQGNKTWLADTSGGAVSIALPSAGDVSPDTLFTVKRTTGGANALTVTPNSGNIDGSAAHSIAIQYAAFSYVSDGTNYHIARQYNPSDFVTSNSLSAAVATDSLVVRGSGAISATASVGFVNVTGGQIKFPATENASSDANTLDDYEEGTFTPVLSATGATFSYATNGQVGLYTKIGRLVCFSIRIQLATSGNTLTANPLTITGLPFTTNSTTNSGVHYSVLWANSTTSYVAVYALTGPGQSLLSINGNTAAATANNAALNADAFLHATNGTAFRVSGCYFT